MVYGSKILSDLQNIQELIVNELGINILFIEDEYYITCETKTEYEQNILIQSLAEFLDIPDYLEEECEEWVESEEIEDEYESD